MVPLIAHNPESGLNIPILSSEVFGVGITLGVGVRVGVTLGVGDGVGVLYPIGVGVEVTVGCAVGVGVAVAVGVGVNEGEGVADGLGGPSTLTKFLEYPDPGFVVFSAIYKIFVTGS